MEHIELSSFPTSDPADLYNKEELEVLSRDFPQGGFVGFDGDLAVAMGLGVQVPLMRIIQSTQSTTSCQEWKLGSHT